MRSICRIYANIWGVSYKRIRNLSYKKLTFNIVYGISICGKAYCLRGRRMPRKNYDLTEADIARIHRLTAKHSLSETRLMGIALSFLETGEKAMSPTNAVIIKNPVDNTETQVIIPFS